MLYIRSAPSSGSDQTYVSGGFLSPSSCFAETFFTPFPCFTEDFSSSFLDFAKCLSPSVTVSHIFICVGHVSFLLRIFSSPFSSSARGFFPSHSLQEVCLPHLLKVSLFLSTSATAAGFGGGEAVI